MEEQKWSDEFMRLGCQVAFWSIWLLVYVWGYKFSWISDHTPVSEPIAQYLKEQLNMKAFLAELTVFLAITVVLVLLRRHEFAAKAREEVSRLLYVIGVFGGLGMAAINFTHGNKANAYVLSALVFIFYVGVGLLVFLAFKNFTKNLLDKNNH